MTTVFRSLMLAVLLATMGIGAVRAGSEAPAGYYADQKVVYHNGGSGPDGSVYFKRLLANLRNHVEAVGKAHVEIRVVSLGDGVGLFQSAANDKELAGRIDALKGMGVRFLVCANTLRERKIDRTTLYGVGEDELVPSGVAELARLQGMGFAYIHP
ncbi:DsrE family protein [Methylobacterium fujisawaense]|uniref:DsrE family protein n=1 Tax=Methylobacterium fujisawaense TaxID=107400 RepID=UPI00313AD596